MGCEGGEGEMFNKSPSFLAGAAGRVTTPFIEPGNADRKRSRFGVGER